MNILIVDDHNLFREGLVSLLNNQPDITVVGEAGSVREAVAKALELSPDLILMDIGLPDGQGFDAAKAILAKKPDIQIVMLTVHESDELLFSAISSGAKGYLLKNTPLTKLLAAIRALERGEAALSRTMTSRILNEFNRLASVKDQSENELENLTSRELEVLEQLSLELSNRQIAMKLSISENTVKVHIHNLLEKLNLHNRREASQFAQRIGLGAKDRKKPPPDD